MEEVRQLVQEEGREARNLVTFHVAVDSPARVSRKPPRSVAPRRAPVAAAARLRSASAGRDKRSELRARYWALLFGDLQRAIGEIYNTVEVHENLNECQEVILVLENYTRDFKALGEWFRLKWEYDNTPPPQRPQSLAWEIRKTDFVRLESKKNVSVKSSPSVSGKNSPCLSGHTTPSGKNSPNLTGKASPGSGKVSPRIIGHSSTSPKANIEFFSNKIASTKVTAKPEARLSDIKEKDTKELFEEKELKLKLASAVEIGKARKESASNGPKPVIIKSRNAKNVTENPNDDGKRQLSEQAKVTIERLDAMETDFLAKHLSESLAKNENKLNKELEQDNVFKTLEKLDSQKQNCNDSIETESPVKSDDHFADISNESSNKSDDDKIVVQPEVKVDTETNANSTNCNLPEIRTDVAHEIIKDRGKQEKVDILKDEKEQCVAIKKNETQTLDKQEKFEDSSDLVTIDKDSLRNIQCSAGDRTEGKSTDQKQSSDSKDDCKKDHDLKKLDSKTTDIKLASKPAYSQAAAKPKTVSTTKLEIKTPTRTAHSITRSKTVVEIRPNVVPKTVKQFTKKNQTSKCSYPFNLTTGRSSLFEPVQTNAKLTAVKKPLVRNVQMAAGDAKLNSVKTEQKDKKKSTSRPTSLKISEKGDRKEKSNQSLLKIGDCEEYSSTDTIVTQIDMSRIESSESLKTLVPEDLQVIHDVGSSIEVLNVDNNKSDNEGWLTVKSKRVTRESKKQSKSHWSHRFNQPSATTSLPTLNMIESPKQENKPFIENNSEKQNRAKSEQPENTQTKSEKQITEQNCDLDGKNETAEKVGTGKPRRPEKIDKPDRNKPGRTKSEVKVKTKDLSMIRQKSDVTGLKTRTARSKALNRKFEKAKDRRDESKLTKNRLHSSLESLTTGLARSQESTEDAFDFDQWKEEFKSTFKYLDDDDQMTDNELLKTADPSEMSEIAEMTSLIEENERKISLALDFQTDLDQRKLCEEEDLLNRQIMELQQVSDIDLDTETDDTETDAELVCCDARPASQDSLGALAASLEDQYETQLEGMSWAERVDTLVVLEALVARDPGRAQQLHEKLSQGIKRRGSLQDALRRLQAKQARAERQRLELQTERSKKIHQLLARVEEVKVAKNQLIEEKRLRMERRLQKAAENREQHLKDIVRKAHDEEEKLREIAFIKQLQEQNKRHEFVEQCRAHTSRLRAQRRDRLTRLEQKAAREAAVGARRLALQEARAKHVHSLLARSRERGARGQSMREMWRRARGTSNREKAEGVKSRLSALAAAAELEADALRERIRDKQDASQQRLESRLRAIRDRATTPRQTLSESHEDDIEEEAERLERERKEKERQKAIKKKARKIKQKLMAVGNEPNTKLPDDCTPEINYEYFSHPVGNKINKILQQISNLIDPIQNFAQNDKNAAKQNGLDEEVDKNNKKNKKPKKITNGDAEILEPGAETNKKNKKKPDSCQIQPDSANVKTDTDSSTNKAKPDSCQSQPVSVNVKSDIDNNNAEAAKCEETSKKKKKKNRDLERAKLSKANSECSSISDMSKVSIKSEMKGRFVIDSNLLERHLNELHRIIDRIDKGAEDKLSYQKQQAVKMIGRILALSDEQEDFSNQISTRCLTTVVTLRSRICSTKLTGSLSDSAHLASILNKLLDTEVTDPATIQLCKQMVDCLSIALDDALCAQPPRTKARQQAHTLVSYICLSGCVTKAEHNAPEIRESVQTLLTVIAELCRPCDDDVGTERTAAAQALRTALGRSLCGSRSELCAQFAGGAGGAAGGGPGGFVRAARTAHLLTALARLDHVALQESFGEGGWPLELRAAVSRLLSQHAPNDKQAPNTGVINFSNVCRLDQQLSEAMVLDLIELVGYLVVNNPQLQETILPGWPVIRLLCTLPANWLVSRSHGRALLPTLIALSQHELTRRVITAELSEQMLEDFYLSSDAQNIKLIQLIKQGREKDKKNVGKK